jgi:HEAT repeat protein
MTLARALSLPLSLVVAAALTACARRPATTPSLGPAPLGALAERFRSGDEETRRDAAMHMGVSGDPGSVEVLVAALDDRSEVVRATVAGQLGLLEARGAVDALLARLAKEKKVLVRKTLASALGEIGDARAVEAIAERLARDKDREVRASLAAALGAIGDRAAIPALLARLADQDAFVRRQAVRSLGLLRAREAVGHLLERLASDEEAEVRRHAARALGLIGEPGARSALTTALHDADPYVADEAFAALALLRVDN